LEIFLPRPQDMGKGRHGTNFLIHVGVVFLRCDCHGH
jgi:hypothetical protein